MIKYEELLINRYPQLCSVKEEFLRAYELMEQTYREGGKILTVGNGGSAADAEHMCGELMKGFKKKRSIDSELSGHIMDINPVIGERMVNMLQSSLVALPLVDHVALTTAYINDADSEFVFAQQLLGFGKKGDVLLAFSTSGNSKNILAAAVLAKAMGIHVIALTGKSGGYLKKYADVLVAVPETEPYLAQELHLPIYHSWCLMLEECFFDE